GLTPELLYCDDVQYGFKIIVINYINRIPLTKQDPRGEIYQPGCRSRTGGKGL
ncbi:17335_t:CDS:1, partial [Dentiscutata heterogama]